ncbi:MAG: YdcF family protein, partial [Alphaproteobacteria bacterium]|nr:YdcF family protein [Alphaproteobacteria bacterium]
MSDTRFQREQRRRRLLRSAAALVVLVAAGWTAGLAGFARAVPERVADEAALTDAIVVLTGGSGRLDAGLDLLARGRAEKLFVSGVYHGVDVQRLLQIARREKDGIETRIAVGTAANTRGNAAESTAWMRREK